ncbi:TonB-dependent receptor [Flammeovirga kamogawensis]|uniref:TonB-dependent receptor n=1 Tax=Flammeovirga kamogawensis TaxID=373891 RepID=A0ABX8GXR1_9BACT|nr:TonB-dependent receptor [Flammeovirga kamogawensis]MBB6460844.1 outer membrane cobalamin receptor [Flammeovirga kamogawensis]QWG08193.1 TonB-dependent receptor [Flammeovirga kamogawensis]TRX69996.1 TonB-dependent receptor [Flammeovirga kamogawensis]
MKNTLLLLLSLLISVSINAQESSTLIKGTVIDGATGEPVIGASVIIDGTTTGAISDFDGNYAIKTSLSGTKKLVISFVGYTSIEKQVELNGSTITIGETKLNSDAIGLAEVEVIASVAIDRKTPVAVSTINPESIETKLGTKEFPEILKSTPGVYATKQGGGYGDARINIRGFNSANVAVMINGVPVNDMENGSVYWSNWAGLSDVTRSMQMQRGLGASKVAVPSVGGTLNILTKTTDAQKGGNIFYGIGNDGREKIGVTLSTGKMDNGYAVTFSGSRTTGQGFVDATSFEGYSYFINVSKEINKNHMLSFTAFGAPQEHGQRNGYNQGIEDYQKYGGIRYNSDWGYLDGQEYNLFTNFYHKPQISLNHYWTINDKSSLSTSAYVSVGQGGGTGFLGTSKDTDNYRRADGLINFEQIRDENIELAEQGLGSETILRSSNNNHTWFGALSVYENKLNDYLTFMGGLDIRYYYGEHYRQVEDLLGGNYYLSNSNMNQPNHKAVVGDKVAYNNDGEVYWLGGFTQLEYSKDKLSAFVSASLSNTTYIRYDYFQYEKGNQKSDNYNFIGYNLKGGLNYNLTGNHNVFFNTGYISRAPFFRSVFPNYTNEGNKTAENEKILSFEVGYGFRSSKFNANLNVYHTQWKDRSFTKTVNQDYTANLLGVNATHQGIELDAKYNINHKLTITGMLSIGDWRWDNDLENVPVFDQNNQQVDSVNVYIKDLHVGNSAQTTAALGLNYKIVKGLRFGVDYNFFGNNYADFDPTQRDNAEDKSEAWRMEDFNVVDLNVSYNFELGKVFNATVYGNVDNLLNSEYITDAQDGADHTAQSATRIYYGTGRTWNMGMKLKF